jgi:chromosome partitioning protein
LAFLKKLEVPFIGALRNSQNYIKAADTGVGIFEMPLADAKIDMKEWEEIIHWIEGKRELK